MSSETLEELKAIRDNAPEGANQVEIHSSGNVNCYLRYAENGVFVWYEGKWIDGNKKLLSHCWFIRSLSDINRIIELMEVESDIRAALKAANIQNRKLLDKTENLKEKIKDIGYSYRRVEQERDELRVLKFKKFNEEECWLYQGNGNDYLESLVCPVVISPEKLIDIINGDL